MAAVLEPGSIFASFVPYHCKLKGSGGLPEPEPRASTSAEAARSYIRRKNVRWGQVVEVYTVEALRGLAKPFEHRVKEYRRPRI